MGQKRKPDGTFEKDSHWRIPNKLWDKQWLEEQYLSKQRSMQDIASEMGVSEPAVRHWIKKHQIPSRNISEARAIKYWGSFGADNPMWNRKGELNPNWKGGVTPERQAFYTSKEWKTACRTVWNRDGACCRRCGLHKCEAEDVPFHIHHIRPFSESVELRTDVNNLALVCEVCHHWIHSKQNTQKEFLA